MTPFQLFVFSTLLLILYATQTEASCQRGWFGSQCQYKCRCIDDRCDDQGKCLKGSTCLAEWFGPACQYADIVPLGVTDSSNGNNLTDGNEETCVDVSSFNTLALNWRRSYPFTWMRIHIDKLNKDFLLGFDLNFNNRRDGRLNLGCKNRKMFVVSSTAIDISCDMDEAVDQLVILKKNVQKICSIYISGGRNVALGQNTSQSTSSSPSFNSRLAVDDKTTSNARNCSRTGFEEYPRWTLNLSQPAVVDRYVLYINAYHSNSVISIESFANDGSSIYQSVIPGAESHELSWIALSFGVKKAVSQVQITDGYKGVTLLSVCEVQIFGDSQCPKGYYGQECNKVCNCPKDEDCFVSTGGCPSGCAAGFFGEGCQEECPAGYHGTDCLEPCSKNCKDESCDRISGKCHECVAGLRGDFCLNVESKNDTKMNETDDKMIFGSNNDTKLNQTNIGLYQIEESTKGDIGRNIGIFSGVFGAVVIILTIVFGIVWHKRKQRLNIIEQEQADQYDDVTSHRQSEHQADYNEDVTSHRQSEHQAGYYEDVASHRQTEHQAGYYEDVTSHRQSEHQAGYYEDITSHRQSEHQAGYYEDVATHRQSEHQPDSLHDHDYIEPVNYHQPNAETCDIHEYEALHHYQYLRDEPLPSNNERSSSHEMVPAYYTVVESQGADDTVSKYL